MTRPSVFRGSPRRRREFERLVTDISASLVVAEPEELDAAILRAQRDIVHCLDLDRSTLFQLNEDEDMVVTHSYSRPEYPPYPRILARTALPWSYVRIRAGHIVQFSTPEDFPAEAAADAALVRLTGPRSNVTFPLVAGDRVFGAMAFGVLREDRRWPPALVRRLQLVAQIVSNTLYRSRADVALRISEHRVTLALTAGQMGLWSCDLETHGLWGSAELCRLFGWNEDKTLALEDFIAAVDEGDREEVRLALDAAMSKNQEFRLEYRIRRPDGDVRWISSVGRCTGDDSGEPGRFLGVSYDVTTRIRAEEGERRAREELAHVTRSTTLGGLSGTLAHELNQPLAAILSNAQAARRLLDGARPNIGETQRSLSDIVDDVKRAELVIRRMRDLVRKGRTERGPVDLRAVIDDVLLILRGDAKRRQISLVSRLEDVSAGLGDRVQFQQVVLNLALNALEASSQGLGREVQVELVSDSVRSARILVRDDGPGLTPEALGLVFEPFYTTRPQGLGLGLSISRAIVHAHGGEIQAESRPGGGACFWFTIPLVGAPPE